MALLETKTDVRKKLILKNKLFESKIKKSSREIQPLLLFCFL